MAEKKYILKNYTTQIKVDKTIMEIEQIMASMGISRLFKLYDDGRVSAIAFSVIINKDTQTEREISFKLPMDKEKALQILKKERKKGRIAERYVNIEQAERIGWRIIKDWIYSQLSLIQIEMAKVEQVFLPFMYDIKNNQTLFEKLEKQNFNLGIEDKTYKEED